MYSRGGSGAKEVLPDQHGVDACGSAPLVAAGQVPGQGVARVLREFEDHPVPVPHFLGRDIAAQRVILVRIGTRLIEDDGRLELPELSQKLAQFAEIGRSQSQRNEVP